jgi:hypothetical protein
MKPELQLCPCCAAHLRVPPQLHVMRCNNCDAELVHVDEGGVRGLALLPQVHEVIPYSDPAQRRGAPVQFNGRDLLCYRRGIVVRNAARKEAFWALLFFASMGLLAFTAVAGLASGRSLVAGPKETLEASAMGFLAAFMALPLIAYTALYFHGRARLVRESVSRWM